MSIDREQVVSFLTDKIHAMLASRGKHPDSLPESFDFTDANLIDSLGFMTLIHELEERFQIELDLSDADPERLVTLGGLADIVVASLPMTR